MLVDREDLLLAYDERQSVIRDRLREFGGVSPSDYLYELLYCLMTPQSSAENADKAVRALQAMRFHEQDVDPEPALRAKGHYIRFHRTKGRMLIKAKQELPSIVAVVTGEASAWSKREWLVGNVKGLGYKEATHFLRNVGKNGGLAILDRHILRNLKRYGAIRTIPKTLGRKQYFVVERKFMQFAERVGIPLDELDLLFWSMETGKILK